MTNELGALYNKENYSYYYGKTDRGFPLFVTKSKSAYHCTRKEAEQFPNYEWIPLSKLKD